MIARFQKNKHRGFSLMELLIAMTIMGFILTLLFSGFRLASTSWDSAERHMDDNSQTQIGRSFLRNMLTQAYPHRWKGSVPPHVAFVGAKNGLRFVTELPAHLGSGGLQQISLNVKQNGEKVELVLRRGELKGEDTDFGPGDESSERVVIGNATQITFSYFGPEAVNATPEAPSRWFDEWANPTRLPKLIRIHINTPLAWPDILVAPLIAQEGNCRWDDFYKRCVGQ